MDAKLDNLGEISKLLSVKSKMSSDILSHFILFSCISQKKRLYLQYKQKYRRTSNEYK